MSSIGSKSIGGRAVNKLPSTGRYNEVVFLVTDKKNYVFDDGEWKRLDSIKTKVPFNRVQTLPRELFKVDDLMVGSYFSQEEKHIDSSIHRHIKRHAALALQEQRGTGWALVQFHPEQPVICFAPNLELRCKSTSFGPFLAQIGLMLDFDTIQYVVIHSQYVRASEEHAVLGLYRGHSLRFRLMRQVPTEPIVTFLNIKIEGQKIFVADAFASLMVIERQFDFARCHYTGSWGLLLRSAAVHMREITLSDQKPGLELSLSRLVSRSMIHPVCDVVIENEGRLQQPYLLMRDDSIIIDGRIIDGCVGYVEFSSSLTRQSVLKR